MVDRFDKAIVKQKLIMAVKVALSCASAFVLGRYLQIAPQAVMEIGLAFLILWCSYSLSLGELEMREIVCIGIFAALLSITLVLGFHISIGDSVAGTTVDNFITPYSAFDMVAFLLMLYGSWVVFMRCYCAIKRVSLASREDGAAGKWMNRINVSEARVCWKKTLLYAAIMFICWLPYFLAYYPGLVFGDTVNSLGQITSGQYTNHHPFAYTMLIRACLGLTHLVGLGSTAGCALYTLLQMLLMSVGLGYIFAWLVARLNIKVGVVLAFLYGLSSYVATFSIALWKDPLFSVALAVLTALLLELLLRISLQEAGDATRYKPLLVWIAIMSAATCLLRSNGIFVIGLTALALLAVAVVWGCRKRHAWRDMLGGGAVMLCTALVCLVITGPLYSALGVQKASNAEGFGVPLNQMARVMALEGAASESDKEYMNALVSGKSYLDNYHPTCTDRLKWDEGFRNELLEEGFWEHWLSMFAKNPITYFEAWELQTCGFWMPNISKSFEVDSWNIRSGVPCNVADDYLLEANGYGVHPKNLLGASEARSFFPVDGYSIPIAWIFWLLLFEVLCCGLLRRRILILVLLPSLGLMASILLATPIFYWPRYAAALQLMIPVYVALIVFLCAQLRSKSVA